MRVTVRSKRTWSLFMLATVIVFSFFYAPRGEACETDVPGPDEDIYTVQGGQWKIIDGILYECAGGQWLLWGSLMREQVSHFEIQKTDQSCQVVNTNTGKIIPLSRQFSSDFEVPLFFDLFGPGKWSKPTLLSPLADTIEKYQALNEQLIQGGDFLDSRIDIVDIPSRSNAVKFTAVAPGAWMNVSKTLVEKGDLCFGKGDDLWFSSWFYVEGGKPATLLDFETARMIFHPGIRLIVREKQQQPYLSMELKFAHKPQYNQTVAPFPLQQWVNVKLHLVLSNHDDGLIEMWQDGTQIMSMNGQTLPTYDTIYNIMQVGITSTRTDSVLIVDDVAVSDSPL